LKTNSLKFVEALDDHAFSSEEPSSLAGNRFERGSMKEEMNTNDNFDKVSHRFLAYELSVIIV